MRQGRECFQLPGAEGCAPCHYGFWKCRCVLCWNQNKSNKTRAVLPQSMTHPRHAIEQGISTSSSTGSGSFRPCHSSSCSSSLPQQPCGFAGGFAAGAASQPYSVQQNLLRGDKLLQTSSRISLDAASTRDNLHGPCMPKGCVHHQHHYTRT